jgi:hypothetical protein
MSVLRMAARKKLKKSQFALPGQGTGAQGKGPGSYPIPDRSHAANALSRASQHGKLASVKPKVCAKFPSLPSCGGSSKKKTA